MVNPMVSSRFSLNQSNHTSIAQVCPGHDFCGKSNAEKWNGQSKMSKLKMMPLRNVQIQTLQAQKA